MARDKMLLVLDETTSTLTVETNGYVNIINNDNCDVEILPVHSTDSDDVVRAQTLSKFAIGGFTDLFIFGNIAYPYAQAIDYTGHGDHLYPFDEAYACPNLPAKVDPYTPSYPIKYVPMDMYPVRIGRCSFDNLPVFAPLKPIDLYRRYLNKRIEYANGGSINYGVGAVLGCTLDYYRPQIVQQMNDTFGTDGWSDISNARFFPFLNQNPVMFAIAVAQGDGDWSGTGLGHAAEIVANPPKCIMMVGFSSFIDWLFRVNDYILTIVATGETLVFVYDTQLEGRLGILATGGRGGDFNTDITTRYRQIALCVGDPRIMAPLQTFKDYMAATDNRLSKIEASISNTSTMKTSQAKASNVDPSPTPSPSPGTSGKLTSIDTITRGGWQGVYGPDGQYVPGVIGAIPSWAQFSLVGGKMWHWSNDANDQRNLQIPNGRTANCDYDGKNDNHGGSFAYDLNITDGQTHRVAVYCLDWDNYGRNQTIQIIDAATGAVLDTQTVNGFTGGKWLVYQVSGHVKIVFTNVSGVNAVCSAIMFG